MPSGSGYYTSNYKQDMKLYDTRFRQFWFGIMCLVIVMFPIVFGNYAVHLINLVAIAVIGALALNLVTGYGGLISLGQAAFMLVGAFSGIFFGLKMGLPFLLVIVLSGAAGAFLGLFGGLPALRLKGIYLALSTLALHFIVIFMASEYQSREMGGFITGYRMPEATIGPWVLDTNMEWYYFLAVVVAITTVFCINLLRTRFGRAIIAIRDREIAASALGVNVGLYKLVVFVFSSALIAIAGCVEVYYMRFASSDAYHFGLIILYLAMIVIGGMGSIQGSFFGAALVILLPYGLAELFKLPIFPRELTAYFFAVQYALFGIIMITFLLLEPRGLTGIWLRIRAFFEVWPLKYRRSFVVTK